MFSLRHLAYATAFLFLLSSSGFAKPDFDVAEIDVDQQLASLPLPPNIEPITTSDILEVVSPSRVLQDRTAHLPAIVEEAAAQGVPPALVDAVVRIESRYDPAAVGSVGEIGLMQVRPKTAALLGFQGPPADLAEPRTNLRFGVGYLAKAWRLAGGDLCRALMKYRAGHRSETMSALSVEYCRRARLHLAAVRTELGIPTEALATPSIRMPKHAVQFSRTVNHTATTAFQRRHRISLNRRGRSVAVANIARITTARVRMATPGKHRTIRLADQASPQPLKRQPRASRTWVAYR
jgi:hypothetical protein